MRLVFRAFMAAALLLAAGPLLGSWAGAVPSPENTLYLDLKDGRVVIELRPDIAPKHVDRIKKLVKEGFYDGLKFHRVIQGFMAQTGDPKGDGTGGSKYPDLPAEFSSDHFERGTVGAARAASPNSANSQFFICFEAAPNLDGQYTIWGQVIKGMEFVDRIKKGRGPNGAVSNPDVIVKMQLASGAK
jgi:peptidylprolyl isomerase